MHGNDEHWHGHTRASPRRALAIALALTGGYAVVEAVGGWLAGSLALVSDAGHMATDAASFVVALIASALAQRPPSQRASYGYARAEVLAAFVNALAMLALVVWIVVEAVARLLAPIPVAGSAVIGIGLVGMAVNVVVAWQLARTGDGLNIRGALLHVFGDLLGSLAAVIAGAVIAFTGWTPIDPILSVLVAVLILRSTLLLLRDSIGVLMERVPGHLSYERVGRALAALPGVSGVHDLHIWTMSADRPALSAHVTLVDGSVWPRVLSSAQSLLASDFGIDHVTLQPSWPARRPNGRVIPLVQVDDSKGQTPSSSTNGDR